MAISNLTEQKTYKSFQSLLQISSSGALYDGTGSLVTNIIASSSYANNSKSSSFAVSASWAPTQNIDTTSLVTTSSFNAFTSSYNTGSFTGSFTGDGSGLTNLPVQNINTSSLATTGSNTFRGNQVITGSLNVTQGITGSLFGTSSWAQTSISSSYPLTVNGTSLRSTYVTGGSGASTTGSIFIGQLAGQSATIANNSNFLGTSAGNLATSADASNFFGNFAGQNATIANNSNFFGSSAGRDASSASFSNFLGQNAGFSATRANQSNFFGNFAGSNASGATNSNFLGQSAGNSATSASYSTLIGYRVGYNGNANGSGSIGSNNIIIGSNITLAPKQKDSINLGGIIFATGSYSAETGGNPYSGSRFGIGRVGINVVNPSYTLEVGGTVAFPNINIGAMGSVLYYNTNTGEITFEAPTAPSAATVTQINTPDNSTVFIRPDELEQSKYATHNIYNNLNFI